MLDEKKWNRGVSMLRGLEQNLPSSIDEGRVNDYHGIVAILEEASGEDLSHFKISPERIKPRVVSVTPGSRYGGPGRVQYSDKIYCNSEYFRSQLAGLVAYLPSLQGGSAEVNPYESLTDLELEDLLINRRISGKRIRKNDRDALDRARAVGVLLKFDRPQPVATSTVIHAHNSNVNYGSPGATITQTIDYKSDDFRNLIGQLKELSPSVSDAIRPQMITYVDTVELQVNSPHPNSTIIQESLRSIRFILETAAGTLAASGILAAIARYIR
jgi:hypothetical protein